MMQIPKEEGREAGRQQGRAGLEGPATRAISAMSSICTLQGHETMARESEKSNRQITRMGI